MANNTNTILGFSVYIETPSQVIAVPEEHTIANEFDFSGQIVSLERIPGESNIDYKQRILDVNVHPGGPTYTGIVNSITRDLGLLRGKALTIELKTNSAGEALAENPRVDILANKVILYHNWKPDGTELIDKTIRFYQNTDDGLFLDDLITEINSSTYFSATIDSSVRPNLHSTNLIRKSSNVIIQNDLVPAAQKFSLVGTYITEGSIYFDEDEIFETEVTSTPSAAGEYLVDKVNGKIYNYSLPSGDFGVSYYYNTFPMEIDYSMVKIYTLQDDDFVYELFDHETLDSGEEINALPNTEGSEIIHQLYKENKMFWGS